MRSNAFRAPAGTGNLAGLTATGDKPSFSGSPPFSDGCFCQPGPIDSGPPLSLLSTGLPPSMSGVHLHVHADAHADMVLERNRLFQPVSRGQILNPTQASPLPRTLSSTGSTGLPRPTPTVRPPGQTHHLSRQNQRLFASFYGASGTSSAICPQPAREGP